MSEDKRLYYILPAAEADKLEMAGNRTPSTLRRSLNGKQVVVVREAGDPIEGREALSHRELLDQIGGERGLGIWWEPEPEE